MMCPCYVRDLLSSFHVPWAHYFHHTGLLLVFKDSRQAPITEPSLSAFSGNPTTTELPYHSVPLPCLISQPGTQDYDIRSHI